MAQELIVKAPFSEKELGRVPFASPEEIRRVLKRARESFQKWRNSSAWERSQLLLQVASELEKRHAEFAQLICQEAGKPISQARGEVDRALGVLRWASSEAPRFGGELLRLDAGATGRPGFGIHTRFPRGVILGITPFNFPINLLIHKVAPALACGCTILIKPSPATPLSALKLVELFEALSPGLVQVVIADDAATAELTRAPEIAMISFTGSARVGHLIRRQAPEKPVALELGGNAWVVVLEDTPPSQFPAIVKRIVSGAYAYAGQSCISVQNAAIPNPLWGELSKLFREATENVAYGNPESASVISGPVINAASAERIRGSLAQLPKGAELVASRKSDGTASSAVVPPSLVMMPELAGTAPLVQEEIFGPVMTVTRFEDLGEIIRQINSSRYGLQTGVFTQNWPAIERLYRELDVGGLVVNDAPTTRYDHQPYGGIKDSGEGREGIAYAMQEMTYSKFLALSARIP